MTLTDRERQRLRLTTRMQAVGEAMAIGRTFPEALQKALRSLKQPSAQFSWPLPPAVIMGFCPVGQ